MGEYSLYRKHSFNPYADRAWAKIGEVLAAEAEEYLRGQLSAEEEEGT